MLPLRGRGQDHASAPPPDHRRPESADGVCRAGEVNVDLVVPVGIVHVEDRLQRLDARIGEEDVDATEFSLDTGGCIAQATKLPLLQPAHATTPKNGEGPM